MKYIHDSSFGRDIFTPANAVSVVGAILSFAGTLHLNTSAGLILVTIGRLFDVIDGPVARRTHTSHIGAVLDATADKFVGLAILIAAYHFKLVPLIVIALIFLYHLIIGILNALIEQQGAPTFSMTNGKRTMFLHICSLLLFVWSNLIAGTAHSVLFVIAIVIVIGSGWFAIGSIGDYAGRLRVTLRRNP
jgi:phosphatidylglycerophosphate synthase